VTITLIFTQPQKERDFKINCFKTLLFEREGAGDEFL